jgi:hypothetical protein
MCVGPSDLTSDDAPGEFTKEIGATKTFVRAIVSSFFALLRAACSRNHTSVTADKIARGYDRQNAPLIGTRSHTKARN